MKQLITLLLATLLLLGLVACGGNVDPAESAASNAGTDSDQAATNANNTSATQNSTSNNGMTLGKLYYVNAKEGEQPSLRGLRLSGNRSGTLFNEKKPGTEGVRSVFELNEWVEFYPDADDQTQMKVYVLKHVDTPNPYAEATLSEETPGYVQSFDLRKESDQAEDSPWVSFYLNPDDTEPGYYDIVFTSEGKPVAVLLTRFYAEGELANKTDEELEELMKDRTAGSVK